MYRTKKVVFEYEPFETPDVVCRCYITHKSHDVFKANCPIFNQKLRYGSYLGMLTYTFSDTRRICVHIDKDWNEYNTMSFDKIATENLNDIQKFAKTCPFNSQTATIRPAVDKSCVKNTKKEMTVVFNEISTKDRTECACNLGVEAFSVFESKCPVCKKRDALDGEPLIRQEFVYKNERHIITQIDTDWYERDFPWRAKNNVQKIQEIAATCPYHRAQKTK